ncbi:hypothetical protein DPMN_030203 [Dreissena polymorpha]|uniref:Uncharacterized protein n=1 Tax=Dreissena polymorpha TaxID=45954 RepID=A0A9D4M0G7_DREPO|nr:hypothetical protein DPMN_030203 [Dreissena polymorpha]
MHLVQSLMRLFTCLMDEIIATLTAGKKEEGDEGGPSTGLSAQQVGGVYELNICLFVAQWIK